MSDLYLFNLYLHVLGAACWTGGMFFFALVVVPAVKQHPDRISILTKAGLRFRTYGWTVLLLMVVTGLGNLYFKGIPLQFQYLNSCHYGKMLGLKLGLFILLLAINVIHDADAGKAALASGMSPRAGKIAQCTGRVSLLITLGILFLGLLLSKAGS